MPTRKGKSKNRQPLRQVLLLLCTVLVLPILGGCGSEDVGQGNAGPSEDDCAEGTQLVDGQCVTSERSCGQGTVLVDGACVLDSDGCGTGTILEQGVCVATETVCTAGTTFDQATRTCVPDFVVVCGENTEEIDGTCVPAETACQGDTVPNAEGLGCVVPNDICGPGTQRDADTGRCIATDEVCGSGTAFDANLDQCVPTAEACSEGMTFNQTTKKCMRGTYLPGGTDCDNPTLIEPHIDTDTILAADNCYQINDRVGIKANARLTVEPGVTIFFGQNAGLFLEAGELRVNGEATNRVIFRGTQEQPGWWRGVYLWKQSANQAQALSHLRIRDAGSDDWRIADTGYSGARIRTGLLIGSSVLSISAINGLESLENDGYGLYVMSAGVDIGAVSNSTFQGNGAAAGLQANRASIFDDTNTFGMSGDGYADGQTVHIRDSNIAETASWSKNVPFEVTGIVGVTSGATLTIDAGASFRFRQDAGIFVRQAELKVDGTAAEPVTMSGTTSQNGWWRGVYLWEQGDNQQSMLQEFSHLSAEHAGSEDWNISRVDYSGARGRFSTVHVGGATVRIAIDNTTFKTSGGVGLFIDSSSAEITDFSSNHFESNDSRAVLLRPNQMGMFSGTSSFGTSGDSYVDGEAVAVLRGNITDTQSISGGVPFVVGSQIRIPGGVSVTLEEGGMYRFAEGGGIAVQGGELKALGTAAAPIVMEGTTQTPSWWRGILLGSQNEQSSLQQFNHLTIRHTGNNDWNISFANYISQSKRAAFNLMDATIRAAFSNVKFEDNSLRGLYGHEAGLEITDFSDNSFTGNATAASIHPNHMRFFTGTSTYSTTANDPFADQQIVRVRSGSVVDDSTVQAGVPFTVGVVRVANGAALSFAPGSELRFVEDGGLLAQGGTITSQGTATNGILLRGRFPLSGWWRGVAFDTGPVTGQESHLEYTTIEGGGSDNWRFGFAGYINSRQANLQVFDRTSLVRLNDLTLSDSGNGGIWIKDAQISLLGCSNVTITDTPPVFGAYATLTDACQ